MTVREQKEYIKSWIDKMVEKFSHSHYIYKYKSRGNVHAIVVSPKELLKDDRFENEIITLLNDFEIKYKTNVAHISSDDWLYHLLMESGKVDYEAPIIHKDTFRGQYKYLY
jgi:hypothetical protein